ncbi:MAG: glycosyltransferase family 2 protein [Candidatus Omnitrophica bacterium]|nr:glycosyltransferase family 2 protein [Candidatus Omnitrophota bacterium]
MKSLAVIIQAYNEVESLPDTLLKVVTECGKLPCLWKIIIVDDGSSDGTGERADKLARNHPDVSVIHHPTNMGMGAALKSGFEAADADYLTSIPADGQLDPAELRHLLEAMREADFVTTRRKHPYKQWSRRMLTRGLQAFMVCLFGFVPRQEAGRMFRREILQHLELTSTSAVLNLELIVKAHRLGYRFREIPMELLEREKGTSKIASVKGVWRMMRELVKLRLSKSYRSLKRIRS